MSEQPKWDGTNGLRCCYDGCDKRAYSDGFCAGHRSPAQSDPSPSPEAMKAASDYMEAPARLYAYDELVEVARALDAFAKRVVDAEREACAKICDKAVEDFAAGRVNSGQWTAHDAARLIRARRITGGGTKCG